MFRINKLLTVFMVVFSMSYLASAGPVKVGEADAKFKVTEGREVLKQRLEQSGIKNVESKLTAFESQVRNGEFEYKGATPEMRHIYEEYVKGETQRLEKEGKRNPNDAEFKEGRSLLAERAKRLGGPSDLTSSVNHLYQISAASKGANNAVADKGASARYNNDTRNSPIVKQQAVTDLNKRNDDTTPVSTTPRSSSADAGAALSSGFLAKLKTAREAKATLVGNTEGQIHVLKESDAERAVQEISTDRSGKEDRLLKNLATSLTATQPGNSMADVLKLMEPEKPGDPQLSVADKVGVLSGLETLRAMADSNEGKVIEREAKAKGVELSKLGKATAEVEALEAKLNASPELLESFEFAQQLSLARVNLHLSVLEARNALKESGKFTSAELQAMKDAIINETLAQRTVLFERVFSENDPEMIAMKKAVDEEKDPAERAKKQKKYEEELNKRGKNAACCGNNCPTCSVAEGRSQFCQIARGLVNVGKEGTRNMIKHVVP